MAKKAFSVVSKKSGATYYLHVRHAPRKDGKTTPLYFFAKEIKDGSLEALPADRVVVENPKTGLPFLKKKV